MMLDIGPAAPTHPWFDPLYSARAANLPPGVSGPHYAPVGDIRPIGGNYTWTL